VILLLSLLLGDDALVLRERATVEGRFVRLLDIVDASRLDEAGRTRLRDVFLGRVPPAGEARILTADEIRRELDWRGLPVPLSGEKVEVSGPGGGVVPVRSGVRRGDVVRALSAAFEADARALESGFPGAVIAIEFLTTKTRARARVTGEGRVEVTP
jgi:hypothetical protein